MGINVDMKDSYVMVIGTCVLRLLNLDSDFCYWD